MASYWYSLIAAGLVYLRVPTYANWSAVGSMFGQSLVSYDENGRVETDLDAIIGQIEAVTSGLEQ